MKSGVESIQHIVSGVQLSSVRLVELSAKTRLQPEKGLPAGISVSAEPQAEATRQGETGVLVRARLHIRGQSPEVSGTALTIKACLELRYKLAKGVVATDAEIQRFANINGIFNAWPYWREIIQNTTTRMSLPPLTLPLYRLPRRPRPQARVEKRKPKTAEVH